jgi:hypothetical protein
VEVSVVKIPLRCHLSGDKMRIPARGIFCTHFMCFDLYNFLLMTARYNSSRWLCPECRRPCHKFKIDSVVLAVLELYSQYPLTEAMWFKNNTFEVFVD